MLVKKILSNSAALLFLEVSSKTMPLLTLPVIARALGPASLGRVGFAISLAGFFGLLVSSGFPTYGVREVAQRPHDGQALVAQLLGARLCFAALAYVLLVAFTFTLAPTDSFTRPLILCSGLSLFVASVDLQWLFSGLSRMWTVALAGIASQVVNAGLTIWLVGSPGHALRLILIIVLSPALAGLVFLWRARRQFVLPRPELQPRRWLSILPGCATLSLAGLMSLIYDQLDLVLLRYFSADDETGVYVAACRVMNLALSFVFFIGQVYFPLIYQAAKENGEQEERYLQLMWNTTMLIALPLSIAGVILARPLTLLILGPQFAAAATLVRWLMPNVVATALAIYFGGRLIHHRRDRQYLISVGAGAASNIVLNLLLMPRFGALAAALTTFISQLLVAGLACYYSRGLARHRPLTVKVASYAAMRIRAFSRS
jgi:O-antigen/teichoic acid export membrane protein